MHKLEPSPRTAGSSRLVKVDEMLIIYKDDYGCHTKVGPVSFEVNRGEVLHLQGANGSGKSSILRSIYGIQDFEGGLEVSADRLAFLPQRSMEMLFPWLSLEKHLQAFGTEPIDTHMKGVIEILSWLDWPREKSLSTTASGILSGGLQQVFALAFVLATPGATLFLLDEPLAALDQKRRGLAMDLLVHLVNGGTVGVLAASHISLSPISKCRRKTL